MVGLYEGGNEPPCSLKAIIMHLQSWFIFDKKVTSIILAVDSSNIIQLLENGANNKNITGEFKIAECAPNIMAVGIGHIRQHICLTWSQATKGNIEGGRFDHVLWIEFGVAQWSERLVRRTKDQAPG
ncbi:hypothetical protein ANN_07715 [Periplaneta americana]|uniref:RNase H type-1 domain-containing protein n=1 Tax=Periplaneta americana TaxID=6978 RepID=A0ABQ8SZC5_PERAM|nr:hypothetical protein ANN_07715 [Periplaneta americana]